MAGIGRALRPPVIVLEPKMWRLLQVPSAPPQAFPTRRSVCIENSSISARLAIATLPPIVAPTPKKPLCHSSSASSFNTTTRLHPTCSHLSTLSSISLHAGVCASHFLMRSSNKSPFTKQCFFVLDTIVT